MGLPMIDLVDGLMQASEYAWAADSDHWRAEMENRRTVSVSNQLQSSDLSEMKSKSTL